MSRCCLWCQTLQGSLPGDGSGRRGALVSVSLPRARLRCRRCVSGVCCVTACTYPCLLLSPALRCAHSLVVVARLRAVIALSFLCLSLCRMQNPRLHGQQQVASQVELEVCALPALPEPLQVCLGMGVMWGAPPAAPSPSAWGRSCALSAAWSGLCLWFVASARAGTRSWCRFLLPLLSPYAT